MTSSQTDIYQTVDSLSLGEFRDRGSRFIAYLLPVESETQFFEFLDTVRKDHLKARHHCYAFRLTPDDQIFRTNDDGEPSGTAGKPIFGQIQRNDLYACGIIVVRYFGGIKLGTSGLINAYKNAAADALKKADIIIREMTWFFRVSFDYGIMGVLLDTLKSLDIEVAERSFKQNPYIVIELRQSKANVTIRKIKAKMLGWAEKDVTPETNIPGLVFSAINS